MISAGRSITIVSLCQRHGFTACLYILKEHGFLIQSYYIKLHKQFPWLIEVSRVDSRLLLWGFCMFFAFNFVCC